MFLVRGDESGRRSDYSQIVRKPGLDAKIDAYSLILHTNDGTPLRGTLKGTLRGMVLSKTREKGVVKVLQISNCLLAGPMYSLHSRSFRCLLNGSVK